MFNDNMALIKYIKMFLHVFISQFVNYYLTISISKQTDDTT